ncbi:MAG: hypothetical protein J7M19_07590 [Planctomycetes bacterium]|nr:hypothetical protein [Planctomycetota bacterium]
MVVFCIVLLGACMAFAQEEAAAPESAGSAENLFVEVGGGWMLPEGEDSTGLCYAGINYGFALVDEIRLGAQVGGKVTLHDDPDWLASAGLFQREVQVGSSKAAWAIQGIYQNTSRKADLISIKPTFGIELDEQDYLAVTGIWGLTEEHVKRGANALTQEPVDLAMLVWGTKWADNFKTEIGAGYEFKDIDAIVVGVHAGYKIDETVSLIVTGAMDLDDNYYAAAGVNLDLGATGRNASFNNIQSTGPSDYTPFPLGSLPVIFYETQETEEVVCPPMG